MQKLWLTTSLCSGSVPCPPCKDGLSPVFFDDGGRLAAKVGAGCGWVAPVAYSTYQPFLTGGRMGGKTAHMRAIIEEWQRDGGQKGQIMVFPKLGAGYRVSPRQGADGGQQGTMFHA